MKEQDRCHSYRTLCVITGCGGGDWPPLLALAEGLQQRGHHVVVVCDKSTLASVNATGLATICLPQVLDLANVFEPAISRLLSRKEKFFQEGENPLTIWGQSCVDYVKKALRSWYPSLVITSLLGLGLGELLAKDLSTPRCFLNPSFYFGHSSMHLWDADFSEMGVLMYRHWLLPLAKTADLVLHATDQSFDICPTVLPPHHKYVGPLFWEMPGNGDDLLQKSGPPWVLIVLSTSPQPGDLTIVRSALKPLESLAVRVLVTLAPGHDKDALGRIPANVYVTGYIPHSRVLPLCRLVISHAGHGIVMKAIAHGVPMVLVPWGRDQPGVAARAKRLGTAVVVPRRECNVSVLTDSIGKILQDPGYLTRSQMLSSRLKNTDGVAKAVDHIERFLINS